MDRREFLTALAAMGATTGTLHVTDAAAQELLKPYRLEEYGEAVRIDFMPGMPNSQRPTAREVAARFLIERANLALPAGTRFDVRMKPADDFSRTQGIAWYSIPEAFGSLAEWDTHIDVPDRWSAPANIDGIVVIARQVSAGIGWTPGNQQAALLHKTQPIAEIDFSWPSSN